MDYNIILFLPKLLGFEHEHPIFGLLGHGYHGVCHLRGGHRTDGAKEPFISSELWS